MSTEKYKSEKRSNKKNIQIQDCSAWLTNLQTSNFKYANYLEQGNRMSTIMNFKTSRVNT